MIQDIFILVLAFCIAIGQYFITNIPGYVALLPIYLVILAIKYFIYFKKGVSK